MANRAYLNCNCKFTLDKQTITQLNVTEGHYKRTLPALNCFVGHKIFFINGNMRFIGKIYFNHEGCRTY